MRSIFAGTIVLSAFDVCCAGCPSGETHLHAGRHRPPAIDPGKPDKTTGADQVHSGEDDLTRRIEQDNMRLDRLTDICPSC
jgi:hypothetical protein